MRLLYIFLDATRSSGVIKKVKSKIEFLNRSGIETTGIFINKNIKDYKIDLSEHITYVPLIIQPLQLIFNRRYIRNYKWFFEKNNYYRQLYSVLQKEIEKHKFDLILFRYPLSNRYLYKFIKRYPEKIIFEHNSKELTELNLRDYQKVKYFVDSEIKYGDKVLSLSRALTGVGNELVEYERKRTHGYNIPVKVVPNSFEVESVPVRGMPELKEKIKILFLTGSPFPWVGIDILLKSISGYEKKNKIEVFIVGPMVKEYQDYCADNAILDIVFFEGEKSGEELNKYFDQCHVAFGTLAMQRVGLKEHSSLKVLEYASRGMPFVITYSDTNFFNTKEFGDFYLQLPFSETGIDLDKVVQFATLVTQKQDHPQKLRDLSKSKIDVSISMKILKDFLTELNEKR